MKRQRMIFTGKYNPYASPVPTEPFWFAIVGCIIFSLVIAWLIVW